MDLGVTEPRREERTPRPWILLATAIGLALLLGPIVLYTLVGGDPETPSAGPGERGVSGGTSSTATTTSVVRRSGPAGGAGTGRNIPVDEIPDEAPFVETGRVVDLVLLPGTSDVVVSTAPRSETGAGPEHRLTRLTLREGELVEVWSIPMPGQSTLGVSAAAVWASNIDGVRAFGFDGEPLAIMDARPSDVRCLSCAGGAGDDLVVNVGQGRVIRVSPRSERPRWERQVRDPFAVPRVVGSYVLVPESLGSPVQAELAILDLASGDRRHTVPLRCGELDQPPFEGLFIEAHPIADSADVLVTWSAQRSCAARVSPASGEVAWSVDLGPTRMGYQHPVVTDRRALVAVGGALFIVDLRSGATRELESVGSEILVPVALGDVAVAQAPDLDPPARRWDAATGRLAPVEPAAYLITQVPDAGSVGSLLNSAQRPGTALSWQGRAWALIATEDGTVVTQSLEVEEPPRPRAQTAVEPTSTSLLVHQQGPRVWMAFAGSVVSFSLADDGPGATWAAPA